MPNGLKQLEGTDAEKDAYPELAPVSSAPSGDAVGRHDWFSEFPDEATAPAPRQSVWLMLGRSLEEEDS